MKNKKTISILVVIALCIAVIAMNSYAFWSITATQSGTNVVGSGCFDLSFTEGDAINLDSQFPIIDADSETLSPYTFTITNTCNIYASYQVNLEVLPVQGTETKLNDQYVKVSLNNSNKKILTEHEEVSTTISGAITSYKLTTGELAEDESENYDLREWLEENTPMSQASTSFRSKITIIAIPAIDYFFLARGPIGVEGVATGVFWDGPIGRDTVETLSFTTANEIPAEVIGSWDAGLEKNGKVMAWYTDTDANGKYEVTVGANGGVYAPENSSSLFSGFSSLNTLNLTNLNTSQVTNMYNMFSGIGNISEYIDYDANIATLIFNEIILNLGDNFDTSNVTDMSNMFAQTGISTLDLGDKFDTSNVTAMSNMFAYTGLTSISITMDPLPICNTYNEFKLDLGDKFDTSNVGRMEGMFRGTGFCNSNFTLDLGDKFVTSSLGFMGAMFAQTGYSNPNFILDLRNFNFGAVSYSSNADAAFKTSNASHTIYASASNIDFMSDTDKGFTGTIINCTTGPTLCP